MTTETNDDVERLRAEVERLRAEAADVSRELSSTRAELDALGVQYEAQRARLALAHVVVDAALAMHEVLSRPVGGDPCADYEDQQACMRDLDAAVSRWRAVPGDVLSLEAHGGNQ
jgi:septal ring factor EnvC (AmiA/AmiB activator)